MEEGGIVTCLNCKREVIATNYDLHFAHCEKKIALCQLCKEPVPIKEKSQHLREMHSRIHCDKCGSRMERWQLEDHEKSCLKRLEHCKYCDLPCHFDELEEHENFCGARTENCPNCQELVLIKNMIDHLEKSCIKRSVPCCVCQLQFPYDELEQHVSLCLAQNEIMVNVFHKSDTGTNQFRDSNRRSHRLEDQHDNRFDDRNRHPNQLEDQDNHDGNEKLTLSEQNPCQPEKSCTEEQEKCPLCGLTCLADELRNHIRRCDAHVFICSYCKEDVPVRETSNHSEICPELLRIHNSSRRRSQETQRIDDKALESSPDEMENSPEYGDTVVAPRQLQASQKSGNSSENCSDSLCRDEDTESAKTSMKQTRKSEPPRGDEDFPGTSERDFGASGSDADEAGKRVVSRDGQRNIRDHFNCPFCNEELYYKSYIHHHSTCRNRPSRGPQTNDHARTSNEENSHSQKNNTRTTELQLSTPITEPKADHFNCLYCKDAVPSRSYYQHYQTCRNRTSSNQNFSQYGRQTNNHAGTRNEENRFSQNNSVETNPKERQLNTQIAEEVAHFKCLTCKDEVPLHHYYQHGQTCRNSSKENFLQYGHRTVDHALRRNEENRFSQNNSVETNTEERQLNAQIAKEDRVMCDFCEEYIMHSNFEEHIAACGSREFKCPKCRAVISYFDKTEHCCSENGATVQNFPGGPRTNDHTRRSKEESSHSQKNNKRTTEVWFSTPTAKPKEFRFRCLTCKDEVSSQNYYAHSKTCRNRPLNGHQANDHARTRNEGNRFPQNNSVEMSTERQLRTQVAEEDRAKCEFCEEYFKRSIFDEHVAICGNREFKCPKCNAVVLYFDKKEHGCSENVAILNFPDGAQGFTPETKQNEMNEKRMGRTPEQLCQFCNEYIPSSDLSRHINECEFREIFCEMCQNFVKYGDFGSHLIDSHSHQFWKPHNSSDNRREKGKRDSLLSSLSTKVSKLFSGEGRGFDSQYPPVNMGNPVHTKSKRGGRRGNDTSYHGAGRGNDTSYHGAGRGSDTSYRGAGRGSDTSSRGAGRGSDTSYRGAGRGNNTHQSGTQEGSMVLVPCEFCKTPILAEELILHESGCKPELFDGTIPPESKNSTMETDPAYHGAIFSEGGLHERRDAMRLRDCENSAAFDDVEMMETEEDFQSRYRRGELMDTQATKNENSAETRGARHNAGSSEDMGCERQNVSARRTSEEFSNSYEDNMLDIMEGFQNMRVTRNSSKDQKCSSERDPIAGEETAPSEGNTESKLLFVGRATSSECRRSNNQTKGCEMETPQQRSKNNQRNRNDAQQNVKSGNKPKHVSHSYSDVAVSKKSQEPSFNSSERIFSNTEKCNRSEGSSESWKKEYVQDRSRKNIPVTRYDSKYSQSSNAKHDDFSCEECRHLSNNQSKPVCDYRRKPVFSSHGDPVRNIQEEPECNNQRATMCNQYGVPRNQDFTPDEVGDVTYVTLRGSCDDDILGSKELKVYSDFLENERPRYTLERYATSGIRADIGEGDSNYKRGISYAAVCGRSVDSTDLMRNNNGAQSSKDAYEKTLFAGGDVKCNKTKEVRVECHKPRPNQQTTRNTDDDRIANHSCSERQHRRK